MELFFWKNFKKTSKIFILIALTLIFLLIIIPLNNYQYPSYVTYILNHYDQVHDKYCNIFTREWIPNPDAPYYTNNTCIAIHEHQNCMKYGRPDTEFLKWRWKPKRCELPIFNPNEFLDMMRNKSLAFVGDSVGRNQMQSLICLLSQVEHPIDISPTPDFNFKKWKYTTYNFTLATYWSPFLVKMEEADSDGPRHDGVFNIYLDEVDKKWTSQINDFNYIILNSGHWFSRLSIHYEKNQLIGCWHCGLKNITQLPNYYGYKRVFKTALKAINNLDNFKGTTFVRTFAPSHFEGGEWNGGGNCLRKIPFKSNEKTLDGLDLEFYNSQVEEFREAKKKGKKRFILMDITQAMLLRPDGHPSRYGHWPNENVVLYNDCVHWCLPGPIDSWNDILLHMLKMEQDIF